MDDTLSDAMEAKLARIESLFKQKEFDLNKIQPRVLENQENKEEVKESNPVTKDQPSQVPTKSKKEIIEEKHKGHLRMVAGQVWEDDTMDQWPENDFRIFCGNLGKEVTSDVLFNLDFGDRI